MSTIFIIGANGGIGRQCVDQALSLGHQVKALVRNPANLSLVHPNLQVVQGDITAPYSFTDFLPGTDIIISAVGSGKGSGGDRPITLYSQSAGNILREMKETGVRRVFFISAAAVETNPLLPLFFRLFSQYVLQKLLANMYADLRTMEKLVRESGLDWTIVRPPRLTDSAVTGKYRMAVNRFLKSGLKISRADTAHFMLSHIRSEYLYQSTVEIAY